MPLLVTRPYRRYPLPFEKPLTAAIVLSGGKCPFLSRLGLRNVIGEREHQALNLYSVGTHLASLM